MDLRSVNGMSNIQLLHFQRQKARPDRFRALQVILVHLYIDQSLSCRLLELFANLNMVRSRRPNGATQTFRRSSFATTTGGQSSQPDTANNSMNQPMGSGTYQPPHTFARNGLAANARYTRDQLLSCYTKQKDAGELVENLADLFIGEFDMDNSNGLTDKKSRRDEHGSEAAPRPDVCLNYAANTEPLGLVEMTAEETEVS